MIRIIVRRKGGPGSGWHAPPRGTHTGEKHRAVGSGKAGAEKGDYRPWSKQSEKKIFSFLRRRVPVKLMREAGLRQIIVTERPEPGHPGTIGYAREGVIRVVEGDNKTALHEVAHIIDLSRFGDNLMHIRTTLRDHPRMGRIGARERVAVFIESYFSEPGSRAYEWVREAFPQPIEEFEDELDKIV